MAKEYSAVILYPFAMIRLIFKMLGSLIWPIKHHKSDFFQRLMELPENVPRCWLFEISCSIFLPMRITAGFPMMPWARGFFYFHYKRGIYPSDWQGPQRGTSFHLFLRIDGPFLNSTSLCLFYFFLNLSREKVSMIFS